MMAHGPNFVPFNVQKRFGVSTVHMVLPALNWQPAKVSDILPEPTSEIERFTLERALNFREFYQEDPIPSKQLASLCIDLIHIFQTTKQKYLIMRCHEAMWEKEYPFNLLTDPLHLFIIHDKYWYDVETLLPTNRRANALDYKRAAAVLRDYRRPSNHSTDAIQLDHAIAYFTERERQCRGAAARRGRQADVPAAGRAWERPA